MNLPRPRIYGHRGCRGLRPENTLAAFLHALNWPIDGLELDVVVSADGQVVVSHEPWLNAAICTGPGGTSLTPESGRQFNLFQQPYDTIRRCDCGLRQHPNFPEQQVMPAYKPLLSEVLTAVAARCADLGRALPAFSIELKSAPDMDGVYHPSPPLFVAQVQQVVEAFRRPLAEPPGVLLMSFDHRVVQAVRDLTAYPVCLLIEDELPVAEHIRQLGFVPSFLGPDYQLLTPALLAYCTALRLPIITWTVNDTDVMQRVAKLGVHGITTDYPNRAASVFHP